MTRSDVHSPKNLVTENYQYVTSMDLDERPPMKVMMVGGSLLFVADPEATAIWLEERRKLFALFADSPEHVNQDSHQCDHCGAHFRYCAILKYKPTGGHLIVGETCLDNRFGRATEDFQAMRKEAQLVRETHRIVQARIKFAEDYPDLAFLASGEIPEDLVWNNYIVDLSQKLHQYGELSERQIAAARRTVAKAAESHQKYLDREAGKATEVEIPVVTGRVQITGVVVSVREPDEYAMFPQWKMLVKDDRGFKVWGSIPQSLTQFVDKDGMERFIGYRALVDQRVAFSASVEKSEKDQNFGFYKRPTKAERLK